MENPILKQLLSSVPKGRAHLVRGWFVRQRLIASALGLDAHLWIDEVIWAFTNIRAREYLSEPESIAQAPEAQAAESKRLLGDKKGAGALAALLRRAS